MDPQLKSVLTSILMTVSGSAATWAVGVGIIPGSDQASLANIIVSVALYLITAALAWYKSRQVTQTAMIQAVNSADNGVKVVSEKTSAPTVSTPLKGN